MLGLIKDDDKTKILQMIDNVKTERKRPFVVPTKIRKKVIRIPTPSELGYRPRLSSIKAPSIKVMYTNADQMTTLKKSELIKKIELHKPMIIAVCEVKTKNSKECSLLRHKKAFDMVPHKRLLAKLEAYGIKGKVLKWIQEFLSGREQYVMVNGEKSSAGCVTSGIPQGTVLGPLLFVVYINDIMENLTSDGFLFADDTKLFRAITSKNDALHLQADIDTLKRWSEKWGMEFNREKCHVLTLGKFENTKHTHRYKLGGEEIEHVFSEKDLGITIDSELTYEDHIANKVRIANGIVGLMRRSFSYLDPTSFKKLFCAFVRPHLEYAQSIWAPHLQKHINAIENVQIRATKLVDGLKNMEYQERLKRCGLTTLLFRRMRGDAIEMWKHFNVYDRDILSSSFTPNERPIRNGKHAYQLYQRRPCDGERGIQSNSYYYRITKQWNDLPVSVVNSKDINSFKNNLDTAWMDHPKKYLHQSDL